MGEGRDSHRTYPNEDEPPSNGGNVIFVGICITSTVQIRSNWSLGSRTIFVGEVGSVCAKLCLILGLSSDSRPPPHPLHSDRSETHRVDLVTMLQAEHRPGGRVSRHFRELFRSGRLVKPSLNSASPIESDAISVVLTVLGPNYRMI